MKITSKRANGYFANMSNCSGAEYLDDSRYLEPPEYDDPTDREDYPETITITLDDEMIMVLADGSWDWAADDLKWAAGPNTQHGIWFSEELGSIRLVDSDDVVDYVTDAIDSDVPEHPGTYLVSGTVELEFEVSVDLYGDDYDSENATTTFMGAHVSDLQFTPVRG